jgi:P4 family phage/plasmid primase-like protien
MITILGLREYTPKDGRIRIAEKFWDKGWRAMNLYDLFNSPAIMESIPKDELYNLFYTVNHVFEGKGRPFEKGYVVAFDIDKVKGITPELGETIAKTVCETIGADYSKCGVVFSGRGVHILIEVVSTWTDPKHFEDMRESYKMCCKKIDAALLKTVGSGKADPAIWDAARILRLPGTQNRKRDKETGEWEVHEARLIKGDIRAQAFDLLESSGLKNTVAEDTIPQEVARNFGKPDEGAILSDCAFMKFAIEEPQNVSEPEWYAMLSIAGRFENASEKAQKWSEGHKGYDPSETEIKLSQTMAFGPRTCKSIDGVWQNSKCRECPKWGKISTPLLIRGPDYIKTKESGFHIYYPDPSKPEKLKCGGPDYEGLRRFYNQQHSYIVMPDSESLFTWDGVKWNEQFDLEIKSFAQKHFNPLADTHMANEFANIVMRNHLRKHEWFANTTKRKMNFLNGVLDLDTMDFKQHSKENGFRKVLPYNYDPEAQAPRFESYLREVTLGRDELADILLEFGGYSLSNDDCWEQKCVVLNGDGANGKSRFVDVLCALAGEGNYSAMTLVDLERDTNRYSLDGSLFNISEETPARSLVDSSLFKNLTGGGKVMVKQLYKQPYEIQNRAKLWLLCNEMPRTTDMTFGMMRRLVIVPFDAKFVGKNDDKDLKSKLLLELPGILNMMLRAYKRMKDRGRLRDSQVAENKLKEYQTEVDSVSRWWRDRMDVIPENDREFENCFLVSSSVYGTYKTDIETEGERPLTKMAFYKRIAKIFPGYGERIEVKKVGNNAARVVKGMRFKEASEF